MRHGLTLIELIVVVAIVGVLLALGFSAVSATRMSARRTVCSGRLSQIGKACLVFESSNQHFPSSGWQHEILPYFDVERTPKQVRDNFHLFCCPADGEAQEIDQLFSDGQVVETGLHGNFMYCYGGSLNRRLPNGIMGRYSSDKGGRVSDIRGGTSNTALASEGLRGGKEYSHERGRLRMVWEVQPENGERHANAVVSLPPDPEAAGIKTSVLTWGKLKLFVVSDDFAASYHGPTSNFYDHVVPPQNPTSHQISPASSDHSVVNVVYCDGHVSPVDRGIDKQVWRDLGSIR